MLGVLSAGDVVVAGGEDRPVCLMSPLSEDRLAAPLPRQVSSHVTTSSGVEIVVVV